MGVSSLREAGEEGAGGGIAKGGRSRKEWEKFRNIGTIFRKRKSGRREGQPPPPPPPTIASVYGYV